MRLLCQHHHNRTELHGSDGIHHDDRHSAQVHAQEPPHFVHNEGDNMHHLPAFAVVYHTSVLLRTVASALRCGRQNTHISVPVDVGNDHRGLQYSGSEQHDTYIPAHPFAGNVYRSIAFGNGRRTEIDHAISHICIHQEQVGTEKERVTDESYHT